MASLIVSAKIGDFATANERVRQNRDRLRLAVSNIFGVLRPLAARYQTVVRYEDRAWTGKDTYIPLPKEVSVGRWLRIKDIRLNHRYGTIAAPRDFFWLIREYGTRMVPLVRPEVAPAFAKLVPLSKKLSNYWDVERVERVDPTSVICRSGRAATVTSVRFKGIDANFVDLSVRSKGLADFESIDDLGPLAGVIEKGARCLFADIDRARERNIAVVERMKDVVAPFFLVRSPASWADIRV